MMRKLRQRIVLQSTPAGKAKCMRDVLLSPAAPINRRSRPFGSGNPSGDVRISTVMPAVAGMMVEMQAGLSRHYDERPAPKNAGAIASPLGCRPQACYNLASQRAGADRCEVVSTA